MRKNFKGFLIGMLTTILLFTTVEVMAAGVITQKISVVYNNIKISVNGKEALLGKDSTGKNIEPFIYNGTTYIPVRAVSEALGERVKWDGITQTVYVGEIPGDVNYLTEFSGAYKHEGVKYGLNDTKYLTMGGIKYETGYSLGNANYFLVNLNSQFKSITFDVGTVNISSHGGMKEFYVYLDGELYNTYEIFADKLPITLTVPLTGVNSLKVLSESSWSNASIGVGNPILD